jgi:hypothetical protein
MNIPEVVSGVYGGQSYIVDYFDWDGSHSPSRKKIPGTAPELLSRYPNLL